MTGTEEWRRCAGCGIRNTGWRETVRAGEVYCPACAQGLTRVPVREMLARRRELLARLEADRSGNPGIARLTDIVRAEIKRLEERDADQQNQTRAAGQAADHIRR